MLSLIRDENLMFVGVENGYAKFLNEKNIQETPVKFFIDKVKESIKIILNGRKHYLKFWFLLKRI